MNEFEKILNKIEISELATYFMYGAEPDSINTDAYQERISNAYQEVYAKLKELFPSADKTDAVLQDIISDFALAHSDVYLQAGVLIGFQLYKVLEEGYHSPRAAGISSVIENCMASITKAKITEAKKKQEERQEEKMEARMEAKMKEQDSIMENFFHMRRYGALEKTLSRNEDYQNALRECNEEIEKLDQCGLSKEQQLAVDKAISATNAIGSEYGAAAYRQGFYDAQKLIRELAL